MSGPGTLREHQGPLRTRVGACFPGERAVFRGHDLHCDLANIDWMDLYVFGITGRRLTSGQIRLLHALWTYTSYPDARLWNNRVAALAGSARSTGVLAVAAAIAVSEAAIYGRQIDIAAADFLVRVRCRLDAGDVLREILRRELDQHRSIPGYGRPVARAVEDERIGPIMVVAQSEGLADGLYLRLARDVETELQAGRWRLRMNYGAVSAALALDTGLSPREYYLFGIPAFLAGMPPCYVEATERPEGATFPLRCNQVLYDGPERRLWGASKP